MQKQLRNGDFRFDVSFGYEIRGACAKWQDSTAIKEQRHCGGQCLAGTRDGEWHCGRNDTLALRITNTNGSGKAAAIIPANGNRDAGVAGSTRLLPGNHFRGERAHEGGINNAGGWQRHGARGTGAPVHRIRRRDRRHRQAGEADGDGEQRDAEAQQLRQEVEQIRRAFYALTDAFDRMQAELTGMRASRSWRVTAPLRAAANLMRRSDR